jgi:hypothetical protein
VLLTINIVTDVLRYQGSLQVVLDDGLELTIPNELLVVPEKLIDDSGEVKLNQTYAEVLIQPTLEDNQGDTPLIGKQFFSSTYLFVDHDAGTFTIWQANSTSDTRLISVGNGCSVTKAQDGQSAPKTQNASETQNAPETQNESGGLSTGAIVGIVTGATGALAALAAIIALAYLKRRKRRRASSENSLLSDSSPREDHKSDPYPQLGTRYELHNVATSELATDREARELDCVESKRGYIGKDRASSHQVYELAARSP